MGWRAGGTARLEGATAAATCTGGEAGTGVTSVAACGAAGTSPVASCGPATAGVANGAVTIGGGAGEGRSAATGAGRPSGRHATLKATDAMTPISAPVPRSASRSTLVRVCPAIGGNDIRTGRCPPLGAIARDNRRGVASAVGQEGIEVDVCCPTGAVMVVCSIGVVAGGLDGGSEGRAAAVASSDPIVGSVEVST